MTPVILIAFKGEVLDSISAYYNMPQNQWFYFLLTATVLLFLVNAFVWEQHLYNAALAFGLALVVLFNHDDRQILHFVGAAVFFLGNAVVIAFFSRGLGRKWKLAFIGVMVLSVVLLLLPWWTLFWAEWVSMIAIAAHFTLDSLPVPYNAMPAGEQPALAA